MVRYADAVDRRWWEKGDQDLINDYYQRVLRRPVQLLEPAEASFGKCIGHSFNLSAEARGPAYIPAFVHKSGGDDACFYFDMSAQVVNIKGTLVNVCHYNPLGPYWRGLFCDA